MQPPGDPASQAATKFVEKWSRTTLTERGASHEHFIDLCRLLDEPTPATADATGQDYCFEKYVKVVRSASKGSKGDGGYVDVWKRGCFAWEYKQKDKYKDLDEAYRQLYQYRDALDNPPLSVVCDIRTTEIRTHFPGYPTHKITIKLEEIPAHLGLLRRLFTDPLSFQRTLKTTETVTKELAEKFGDLANSLIARYPLDDLHLWESAGSPVAHFLMKVMFCLFAEDVGLLPAQTFTKLINLSLFAPENFEKDATQLFDLMRTGGRFGFDTIPHFNGGLFDKAPALPLTANDLNVLRRVAGDNQNWAGVEPSIFGTLFERILDPRKRAQIGAHYTSKADILLVVEPVVMTPLRRKWQEIQDNLKDTIAKHDAEPNRKKREPLAAPITIAVEGFRRHLAEQRILDPACGSGNFLYVALQQLMDLEDDAIRFCAARDIAVNPIPYVRPTQLRGIEINPYAAELAQVVIWIGYLQWFYSHGIDNPKRPILDKLQTIENRDAILMSGGPRSAKHSIPAEWPEADFIIGNPPFLGGNMIRQRLGDAYVDDLFRAYDLPKFCDLCCYWFELARRMTQLTRTTRAGLLATQGVRGGVNREVLRRINEEGAIFNAWSSRDWVLEGASVDVSIICFDAAAQEKRQLDGKEVEKINPDLTRDLDLTTARPLTENFKIQCQGDKKGANFELNMEDARKILSSPNPTSTSILTVCRPWVNGREVNQRATGMWIIDFGCNMEVREAAKFEAAFEHIRLVVAPFYRDKRERWWLHERPRPELRAAIDRLPRFLFTTGVSKHRFFVWLSNPLLPDHGGFAFARDDDYFFGILQSSTHVIWALRLGTHLEDRPRYTPSTCFETFPLPWPPGKENTKHPAYIRIAAAAKSLNEQRERWLNPPEWIDPIAAQIDATDNFADVPEEARPLIRRSAILAAAAKDPRLKNRTLTNLYNERPTWLKLAHQQLDQAVLAAYAATDSIGEPASAGGSSPWQESFAEVWTETGPAHPLPANHPLANERATVDRQILENLLRLNHARSNINLKPSTP